VRLGSHTYTAINHVTPGLPHHQPRLVSRRHPAPASSLSRFGGLPPRVARERQPRARRACQPASAAGTRAPGRTQHNTSARGGAAGRGAPAAGTKQTHHVGGGPPPPPPPCGCWLVAPRPFHPRVAYQSGPAPPQADDVVEPTNGLGESGGLTRCTCTH
jgi:hypothetical protein